MSIACNDHAEWQIGTTGTDPWLFTMPLEKDRAPECTVVTFEFFCPDGFDHLQIFTGPEIKEANSLTIRKTFTSEGWITYSVDLKEIISGWGKKGDFLRIDFGTRKGVRIGLKNMQLRALSTRETEQAAHKEEKMKMEAEAESSLDKYLSAEFSAKISFVQVFDSAIIIRGKTAGSGESSLCEFTPYQDVTGDLNSITDLPLKNGVFECSVRRFILRDGFLYDRILSRWAVVMKEGNLKKLASHAHYPDSIKPVNDLAAEFPKSRKGLGGYSVNRSHQEDLDELGIESVTVNILLSGLFSPGTNKGIRHDYNGKAYWFREKEVSALDSTFRTTSRKGIITAAILLVDKTGPDNRHGYLLRHPDLDPAGIYSMPNMTTPASVNCYAAVLDFLAERYSRADRKYGRINHYIIHNEVDAGWVWTNMGEKSALLFMDTYIRSMRMCYSIARNYNPVSEVFISLTHQWTWASEPRFYPAKELLDILLRYTSAEGDFRWAVAQHPYPRSLYEPKTWLDTQVDSTLNTPLITFKNLEVINKWIVLPEVLYRGRIKRTLWLSENGTNSKSYSEKDLAEQAAGFAYAWKKMEKCPNIDGFQWHNWFDHKAEGGLRIGLRRFPDDREDAGGAKPVWFLYQAAGTKRENAAFKPYLKIIGIKSWKNL